MKVEFLVWNFSAVVKYPFKTASKNIVSVLLTLNLYLTTSIVFPFSFLSTKIYLELTRGCQKNLIGRAYSRHSFHVLVVWCLVCCCPIILIFSLLLLMKMKDVSFIDPASKIQLLGDCNWSLGRVRDTKFGTIVSNKRWLNTTKSHGYSFYRFWVIKWKPSGGEITPSHTD